MVTPLPVIPVAIKAVHAVDRCQISRAEKILSSRNSRCGRLRSMDHLRFGSEVGFNPGHMDDGILATRRERKAARHSHSAGCRVTLNA